MKNSEWRSMIDSTVDVILNTRDFCGNEKLAALELLAEDYGVTGPDALRAFKVAKFEANRLWNQSQRQAGVPEKYLF